MTLTEFYFYDGSNLLLVLDGSGNVKQRYFNGPNENQVLAEETNIVSSGAGDTHWALTDHEGSVRDVIDDSGSVLDHIQYDSFGNILSQGAEAGQVRFILERGRRSTSGDRTSPGFFPCLAGPVFFARTLR